MASPEQILESLLDAMKQRVRDQELEITTFRKVAAEYQKKAEAYLEARDAEIARTLNSIQVFEAELAAMRGCRDDPPPKELLIPSFPAAFAGGDTSESERIRDAARRILGEAGRPLMQREIKAKMDEIGVVIQSADPVELIRAALRRHAREFRHVKGQGWALVSSED